MKKPILLIISFIFSISAVIAQYENADAVFEKVTKEYTLNQDGTTEFHYYKQLKLQSFLSFNRLYGETFIVYNPDFQKLKINDSYTIMANGKKIETPGNAFNEVLPRFAAHSSYFNNLREMVVTHTATEIGASLFLDYTVTNDKDFMPALMGDEIIEESSPIKDLEIIVKVPADIELKYKMFNLRTAPEIMIQGNMKIFTWKFSGIDASPKEPFIGTYNEGTPRLIFSTAENMEKIVHWITYQDAFKSPMTEEMKTFADKIKAEKKGEIATLMALQEQVVKNMAFDNVPAEVVAFRSRTPEEVWKSNGGTELEKAILLSALLNEADILAFPVLSGPKEFYDKEVGDLLIFEHVYVQATTKNEGDIYISASQMNNESLEYSSVGDVFVPLDPERSFNSKEIGKSDNQISVMAEFSVDSLSTIAGEMNMELYFAANPFLAMANDQSYAKQLVNGGLSANDVQTIKLTSSNQAKSVLSMKIQKKDPFMEFSGYYRWELPVTRNGFESWHIGYLDPERNSTLEIPFPLVEEYEFMLKIPEGYEFLNLKSKNNLKNKAGSIKIEFIPKANSITVTRKLDITSRQISMANYADFRDLINAWLGQNQRSIVFKKVN